MTIHCPLLKNKNTPLTETDEQLIWKLLSYAPISVLTGLAVSIVVGIGLYGHVATESLISWWFFLFCIYLVRLSIPLAWKRLGGDLKLWGRLYLSFTLLAGFSWAALISLYSPSLGLNQQLLILLLLIGMPVASIPGNAIYLSFYIAFSTPILLIILYWSLFLTPQGFYFAGVDITYAAMLFLTARVFHNSLRQTVEMRFENLSLIKQLSDSNERLEKIAYVDPLTGLSNRRLFQRLVEEALKRRERNGSQLALMLIDIDRFKEVNDTLGHEAGDQLLITISKRLNTSIRQTDTVIRESVEAARYGGDEFIILVEDIKGKKGAELVVQRIEEKLKEPVLLAGRLHPVTVSIGVALIPDHAEDFLSLTRCADSAMYKAKNSGRNQYQFFTPELEC